MVLRDQGAGLVGIGAFLAAGGEGGYDVIVLDASHDILIGVGCAADVSDELAVTAAVGSGAIDVVTGSAGGSAPTKVNEMSAGSGASAGDGNGDGACVAGDGDGAGVAASDFRCVLGDECCGLSGGDGCADANPGSAETGADVDGGDDDAGVAGIGNGDIFGFVDADGDSAEGERTWIDGEGARASRARAGERHFEPAIGGVGGDTDVSAEAAGIGGSELRGEVDGLSSGNGKWPGEAGDFEAGTVDCQAPDRERFRAGVFELNGLGVGGAQGNATKAGAGRSWRDFHALRESSRGTAR